MKQATFIVWLIAGLLSCLALGIDTGHKAGYRAGLLRAMDDLPYCYENGATGYYNTDKEIRCIYD